MENIYITITGLNYYFGLKPFKVNRIVKLVKEPDNEHDDEAIRVELPYIDTIGYVANSTHTVYGGTHSAGRIYNELGDIAYAQVKFITRSSVIAQVIPTESIEMTEQSVMQTAKTTKENPIRASFKIGF